MRDLNPIEEDFEPIRASAPPLRIWVLRGRRTVVAWCHDVDADWIHELDQGRPAPFREGLILRPTELGLPPAGDTYEAYDPWTDASHTLPTDQDRLRLPRFRRSLVLRWGQVSG